jgi:hypothetical protein
MEPLESATGILTSRFVILTLRIYPSSNYAELCSKPSTISRYLPDGTRPLELRLPNGLSITVSLTTALECAVREIVLKTTPLKSDGVLIWADPLVYSLWWKIENELLRRGEERGIQFFSALKGISKHPVAASVGSRHTIGVPSKVSQNEVRANDTQIGGSHYKTAGEEHWDRVRRLGLDYFQAQITKYTERCWRKNGLQDLQKARHFLDKYIEILEAEAASKPRGEDGGPTASYVDQARDSEAGFGKGCSSSPG